MNASAPVVDVAAKTVSYKGTTYIMRPLAEDAYTVMLEGVPVGRVVFSFGAANAIVESDKIDEDGLYAIGEAWFTAIEA